MSPFSSTEIEAHHFNHKNKEPIIDFYSAKETRLAKMAQIKTKLTAKQ